MLEGGVGGLLQFLREDALKREHFSKSCVPHIYPTVSIHMATHDGNGRDAWSQVGPCSQEEINTSAPILRWFQVPFTPKGKKSPRLPGLFVLWAGDKSFSIAW